MEILNKKQKIIIILIVIFMLVFIGYYIINKVNNTDYITLETEENQLIEDIAINEQVLQEQENIIIHVTGEVKEQGIVEVHEGARISDVIKEAGGVTDQADLSKINLAYEVQDGQKIYVPNMNDQADLENISKDAGESVLESNSEKLDKVNINTALQTELETLNGIGPSTALKIINYRQENGDFKKIEDIKNVPGIGEAKFESLKNSICVR